MAAKKYSKSKDGNKSLSSHFKVREFACKDGSDKILINSNLITILEKLYTYLDGKYDIKAININSGYRTPAHSVKVGGYSTDQHTKGNAADIIVKLATDKTLEAKKVCLALEDLNHKGGVGYISKTATHVDVRGKKVWFDETKNEKTTSSWYSYWGIEKPKTSKTVKAVSGLKMRSEANTKSSRVTTIPYGKKVTIIKENAGTGSGYTWDYVSYKDKKGYCANKYLK